MPDPGSNGSSGYLWLFRFLHSVAGNITTAFGSKIPGMKILAPLFIIPALFAATACAGHYSVRPGALNRTESAAYDTLLIAETVIDQAKADDDAGRLPSGTNRVLGTLIQSYNIAREAWLTYRSAVAAKAPSELYFNQLTKNIADLTNAIRMFEEAR